MANLISNEEAESFRSAMKDLHDTYARDIVIYKTAQKTIVSTNVQHNFLYDSGPYQTETEDVVVSGTYQARIHYPSELKIQQFLRAGGSKNEDQLQLKRKDYKVKLVVEEDVKNILINCERIEFDGVVYMSEYDPYPHGVIGVQFWNFYLQALN
jgi:hypothetical protein